MKPVGVLTVDDEKLALRRLQISLRGMVGVQHLGEASSCAEAIAKLSTLRPDVILLDIMMRDGDGFEVAKALTEFRDPPIVIFVSAFDEFAVRAFEAGVADYLLKPVPRERLERALGKARDQLQVRDAEQRLIDLQAIVRTLRAVAAPEDAPQYETEFWLRGATGVAQVSVDSIDCVSSEDDYVAVHTRSGAQLMRASIRQFEARVEPGHFVRVHRRWLVRKSAIAELRTPRVGRAEVLLRSGKRVPVGRVYLKALRTRMRDGKPDIRSL